VGAEAEERNGGGCGAEKVSGCTAGTATASACCCGGLPSPSSPRGGRGGAGAGGGEPWVKGAGSATAASAAAAGAATCGAAGSGTAPPPARAAASSALRLRNSSSCVNAKSGEGVRGDAQRTPATAKKRGKATRRLDAAHEALATQAETAVSAARSRRGGPRSAEEADRARRAAS
jgi:hypothetical protein